MVGKDYLVDERKGQNYEGICLIVYTSMYYMLNIVHVRI